MSDSSGKPGLRVAFAEDSAILRDGLTGLLNRRGHDVVISTVDADSLERDVRAAAANNEMPDIIISDIRMPPTFTDEGLRAALALRADYPALPILIFSQHVEIRYVSDLLATSADGLGYLLKDRVADTAVFMDTVSRVAAGETVLDPDVVRQLIGSAAGRRTGVHLLTARERDVLDLMAQGRSNGAIAQTLHVSYGAIEKYVASVFIKLDITTDAADHRRVLAVLTYLNTTGSQGTR